MTADDLGPDLGSAYGDQTVLRHVLDLNPEGWALEFGVGGGGTLATIAERMPVIGFDSFGGLPEDWRPGFGRGKFAQTKIPQIEGATVVVGLFEDTLPAFDWPEHVGLFHFDADLYSSTRTALQHCGHLIGPGALIVFDEYFGYDDDHTGKVPGEQRAWQEWALEHLCAYQAIGHGREQVAFRIIGFGELVSE